MEVECLLFPDQPIDLQVLKMKTFLTASPREPIIQVLHHLS